jgi:tRNA 2-selenouridine synthase SelU
VRVIKRIIGYFRKRREMRTAEEEAAAFAAERKKEAMDGFETLSGLQSDLAQTSERLDLDRLEQAVNGNARQRRRS